MIRNLIIRFERTGSVADILERDSKRTMRCNITMQVIRQNVLHDPSASTCHHSAQLGIARHCFNRFWRWSLKYSHWNKMIKAPKKYRFYHSDFQRPLPIERSAAWNDGESSYVWTKQKLLGHGWNVLRYSADCTVPRLNDINWILRNMPNRMVSINSVLKFI